MRPIYLVSKTPYEGVIHLPVLAISFLTPTINFSDYDGIIITSKQGAQALSAYTIDWNTLRVICVGEATAGAMKQLGAKHLEIADGYGETIFNVLRQYQGTWLYCRPKIIASSWPKRARESGMIIDEVVIYETLCNQEMKPSEIADSSVLIFTSPSSIECFRQHYDILPTHKIVAIGKTTQNALPSGVQSTLSETTTIEACVKRARELAY